MNTYPNHKERDYAGVCILCWKMSSTVVIDRLRNDAEIHLCEIEDNDNPHDYREVTSCCHSEDFIPMAYATKCVTCREWVDERRCKRIGGDHYECEMCQDEKTKTISVGVSSLPKLEHRGD